MCQFLQPNGKKLNSFFYLNNWATVGNKAKKKKKHNFYIKQREQREKLVNCKNYSNYLFPRLGLHQRISNPAAQQA